LGSKELSGIDECDWYNAANKPCSSDGLVLTLNLTFNSLDGTIPAEIALLSSTLSKCLHISKYSCSFVGLAPFVTVLDSFTGNLHLSDNSLSGKIPSEIGLLTELGELLKLLPADE